VVIIGGGPGGYEAALVAAQLGAEVTVVDRDGIGGSAVLTDCVPSKTLIATAEVMTEVEGSGELGLRFAGSADGAGVTGEAAADASAAVTVDLAAVNTRVKALFKYFNSFMTAERNGFDVLVCDEAHRMRETSANRYTRAELRTGRPQVRELIDAARVPVFLLDQHQVVRPGETGTAQLIRQHAGELGLDVVEIALDAQFRCGGSRTFEEWVLRLLGLDPGGPIPWTGDTYFELQVASSPAELERALQAKADAGYGARMTAGFCCRCAE